MPNLGVHRNINRPRGAVSSAGHQGRKEGRARDHTCTQAFHPFGEPLTLRQAFNFTSKEAATGQQNHVLILSGTPPCPAPDTHELKPLVCVKLGVSTVGKLRLKLNRS